MKMKLLVVILILINVFSYSNPQTQTPEVNGVMIDKNKNQLTEQSVVDIKKIVAQQIEGAMRRRYERILDESLKNIIRVESTNPKSQNLLSGIGSSFTETIDKRILILCAAGVLLSVIIAYRRIRLSSVQTEKSMPELKRKIAMIRNEEPLIVNDDSLSKVRKNLRAMPPPVDKKFFDRTGVKTAVSKRAKELNISQGEILLASKLRFYETAGR